MTFAPIPGLETPHDDDFGSAGGDSHIAAARALLSIARSLKRIADRVAAGATIMPLPTPGDFADLAKLAEQGGELGPLNFSKPTKGRDD